MPSLTVAICKSRVSCKSCKGKIARQQPLFLINAHPVARYHLSCYQPQPHVVREKSFLLSLSQLDKNLQLNVLMHLPKHCRAVRAKVTLLEQSLFGDCSRSSRRKINGAHRVMPATVPKPMVVSRSSTTASNSQPPERVAPSNDRPKLPKPQSAPLAITPVISSLQENPAGISFSRRLEKTFSRSSSSMPASGHSRATSSKGPLQSSSAALPHQPTLETNIASRLHSSTAQEALPSTGKDYSKIEGTTRSQSSSRHQKRSAPTFLVVKDTEDSACRAPRDLPHNSTIYLASPFGWHKLCPGAPAIPILDGVPLQQPSLIGRLPLSDTNLKWNPFRDTGDGDSWLFQDESSESNSSDCGSDEGTSLDESESNSSDCGSDDGDLHADITLMSDCDESTVPASDDESGLPVCEGYGYGHGALDSASRAVLCDHTRERLPAREENYFEMQDSLFPLQPAQQVPPKRSRSSAARESFLVGLQRRTSSATTKQPPVQPTVRARSMSLRSSDGRPCLHFLSPGESNASKALSLPATSGNTIDHLI